MNEGPKLLRFNDLAARGIVRSREQLRRMIANQGFPAGFSLGPNTRVWDMQAIEAWLDERRQGVPAAADAA